MSMRSQILQPTIVGLLLLALITLLPGIAFGQTTGSGTTSGGSASTAIAFRMYEQPVGAAGLSTPPPKSAQMAWYFGTNAGDPLQPSADKTWFIRGATAYLSYIPYTAATGVTMRDGANTQTLPSNKGGIGATGGTGSTSGSVGTTYSELAVGGATGILLQNPVYDPVTQTETFSWNTNDTSNSFTVTFTLKLIRDVGKWQYQITNNNPQSRRIGFRIVEPIGYPNNSGNNYNTGVTVGDGNYYFGGKFPYNSVQMFSGSQIANEWNLRYNPGLGQSNQRPIWSPRQPLAASAGMTPPDYVVFAHDGDLSGTTGTSVLTWPALINYLNATSSVNPFPLTDLNTPIFQGSTTATDNALAVGLYYSPANISLGPGQTFSVNGQVEMNWATTAIDNLPNVADDRHAVAVIAPDAIKYEPGQDPNNPSSITNGYFSPSSITVRGFAQLAAPYEQGSATMSIDCDPGLALASGQPRSYTINQLNKSGTITDVEEDWTLVPTGTASGNIGVRITTTFSESGTSPVSLTSTVHVNVPAMPRLTFPQQSGIYLMGFPFAFSPADASSVFGGMNPNLMVAQYNTSTRSYQNSANTTINLNAGQGYWVFASGNTSVPLNGATPIDQSSSYSVNLSPGWNLLSDPYQYSVDWGACNVLQNGHLYSFYDAVNGNLLRKEIWTWNPADNSYNTPITPSSQDIVGTGIIPFTGYWVYANKSITMVFTPDPFVTPKGISNAVKKPRQTGRGGAWQVNLQVTAGSAKDRLATFGIIPGESDGVNPDDMMKPPASPRGVSSYFVRADGISLTNLAVDVRPPSATCSWALNVDCPQPHTPVTLSWPDLTQLPPNVNAVLVDETTGKQQALRTSAGYYYDSGAGGVRQFTINIGGVKEYLRVMMAQQSAVRGGSDRAMVTYSLSETAQVTVRFRTPLSRIVRTLAPVSVESANVAMINWNGMDDQGRPLPVGLYLCDITAESADGQRTHFVLPVQLN